MNTALWVVQGILAAMFLMAGAMKAMKGQKGLMEEPRTAWAEDVPDAQIRIIGMLEVLAAVGLVLPMALDIVPILTAWAAAGVVVVLAGSIVLHKRRGESQAIMMNGMFMILGIFVAWGRFTEV
jgi:uncharacterized membrane protein YphA (DoxX/SURF4 family)